MIKAITVFALILLLGGCATPSTAPAPETESHSIDQTASLFPGDAAVLSDAQILDILEAQPKLPTPASVALVHLEHKSAARFWGYGPYWTALLPGTRQQLATELAEALTASDAVSEADPLPIFLLPEKPSVGHLREATARFRADAVVVFRSDCQAYERYRFFRASQAKAFCSLEAALLDVRTGIVPYTAATLQDFTVTKSSSDANMIETVRRAETQALGTALREVGEKIGSQMAAGK